MLQEFVHQIKKTIDKAIREVHTAMPGEIVTFDAVTGLATVVPKMKFRKPDGKTIDYPQLSGVPVVFPQGWGGNATIAFPVKSGDSCLIIIAEQALDYWLYGQMTDTNLAFDLTNAICIPGLFNTGNPVMAEACQKNAVVVDVKGTRMLVRDGEIVLDAPTVKVNGNLSVRGKVESDSDTV